MYPQFRSQPSRATGRAARWACSSWLALALALALGAAGASAQVSSNTCGALQNAYGPYDYRREQANLKVVEGFHFSPEVESLIRGKNGSLGEDIDYTLRASPNHHRALVAMMRLFERGKGATPRGANYSIECYFERAVRFASNDTVARSLYATFLNKAGRQDEATMQLELATAAAGDNGFAHYNIGLVYAEMKSFDRALVQAHRAMEFGFIRPPLVDALKQAGVWRDPPDAAGAPAAASAPAPAASQP